MILLVSRFPRGAAPDNTTIGTWGDGHSHTQAGVRCPAHLQRGEDHCWHSSGTREENNHAPAELVPKQM